MKARKLKPRTIPGKSYLELLELRRERKCAYEATCRLVGLQLLPYTWNEILIAVGNDKSIAPEHIGTIAYMLLARVGRSNSPGRTLKNALLLRAGKPVDWSTP